MSSNDGFAGSNHDIGSFSEVDEELRQEWLNNTSSI